MRTIRTQILILPLSLLFFYSSILISANIQDEPQGDRLAGGLLYSAWDIITSTELSFENHPLWFDDSLIDINSWRCSTCHGWDYSGRTEVSSLNPEEIMEYPALFSMMGDSVVTVIAWLDGSNNPNHDFSQFLTEKELNDLSAFLISGLIKPDLIAELESSRALGTFSAGERYYKQECRECHSSDGARINFGSASKPSFLGNIANSNPWYVAHTIRFGHIYTKVQPGVNFGWSFNQEIDLLTYLQHLPKAKAIEQKRESEVIDYSEQGDMVPLVYASIVLVLIILGGVYWSSYRFKN